MPLRRTLLTAALLGALVLLPALAQKRPDNAPLSGVVTRVIDGDTLLLQPAGKPPMEVRLRNIDAPESCQPWGPESKRALEEYALGKTAELRTSGRDSYGRVIGSLSIPIQGLDQHVVVRVVFRSLVFLYACEVLLSLKASRFGPVGMAATLALVVLGSHLITDRF